MAINLQKGQRESISAPKFTIGLGWDTNSSSTGAAFDLDASIFIMGDNKKLLSDEHFIFYNNLKSPDGAVEHTAAQGNGPVNALDRALRKALTKFYPQLEKVVLHDYKVRVLGGDGGTGATVRVLIESGDEHDRWGTVGVSPNVIEASWQALVDSIEYKLYKDKKHSAISHQRSAIRD